MLVRGDHVIKRVGRGDRHSELAASSHQSQPGTRGVTQLGPRVLPWTEAKRRHPGFGRACLRGDGDDPDRVPWRGVTRRVLLCELR
jgi:hypothetical protein